MAAKPNPAAKDEFTSLVENALDFLEKSIRDFEAGESKYSVIHFYSGLELILKARLLLEHWSLCASDVNKMARIKFAAGDFQSIGLDEAKSRLANILGCHLTVPEEKVYQKLRKRRNQAVHFYHPDDLGSGKKVAVEQLAGWYFLYRRLTDTWKDSFEPFRERLEALHRSFSVRKEYYPSIYLEIKDDLLRQSDKRLIAVCEICDQVSALERGPVVEGMHRMECEVCGRETFVLFLPCRKCKKPAPRMFEEDIACQFCGQSHRADVEESFDWAKAAFPTLSPRAWCGDCGYSVTESVIEIGAASLCLACHAFDEYSSIGCCPWCNNVVTGPVGNRTDPACVRCQYELQDGQTADDCPEFLYHREDRRAHRFLRQEGYI